MGDQSALEAPTLGRLVPVDLREAWRDEARHFTPWLAKPENITLLGDSIGIQLEVMSLEKFVGPFRADILCKDMSDHYVLIENQLETTDHVHLGQLLTYAAGLVAVTIVWIARSFTDEHRAALDWLNNTTKDGFNFFGLEVDLWRIGNSPMAPKFNVVSKPNNWTKSMRGPLTETQLLHFEFWTQFQKYLEDHAFPIRMSRPPKAALSNVILGPSLFRLKPWRLRDDSLGVWVRFAEPNARGRYETVELRYRHLVEERLKPLGIVAWLPETDQGTIQLQRSSTLSKPDTLEDLNRWLAQALETTYTLFNDIVPSLNAEGIVPDSPSHDELESV